MALIARSRRAAACLGGAPAFAEPVLIGRPRLPDQLAFAKLVASVFQSRWLTNDGVLVRKLEKRLRLRLGVGFCAAFCNGTTALQAALRSLDLAGEVITTPFTFPATVHAITWVGLTPVFCDVDRESYNLDVARASELVSSRTSAVVPVHVFGNPCDVAGIERLAATKGLKVIYDAAHAFGVSCRGRPIGCWGDLSVLSFHATKLFHTAEGGAVVSGDAAHWRKLTLLRNFGIVNEEEVSGVGINGKLSEVHAAIGLGVLERVDAEISARGRLAARYRERLARVPGLAFQRLAPGTVPNHAYFTIEVDPPAFGLTRDELHVALRAENVFARKYFFPLCSDNPYYRHLPSARPDRLPNARAIASRVLCLPCHGDLEREDVDRIVDCIVAIKSAAPRIRKAVQR
jgi:dTDP-4-amino-4,6-dideoxygalactose transaminase